MALSNASQLDELERAKALPLATDCDCDREHVVVQVPFIHGLGGFSLQCVVIHDKRSVISVEFPVGWRAAMREHGFTPDERAEQLIESLAWVQWLRRFG